MILHIDKINKSFNDKKLLNNISFILNNKDVAFIIGANGCGKTTFFNILTNTVEKDSGDITLSKGIKIATLNQFSNINSNNTIYEEVLEEKKEVIDLFQKLSELEHDISQGNNSLLDEHDRIHNKILNINGYAYKSEVDGIISGLQFSGDTKKRLVRELSGGERNRLFLAKMFASDANLILLDEPTNHLDISGMKWLEDYIKSSSKTFLIISHDRYFMDRCANKIIEFKNTKANIYHGNYTEYIKKSEQEYLTKIREYKNQQAYIEKQTSIIKKFKQFNREKSLKQARSREKLLNKLELVENPYTDVETITKLITAKKESGNDVLICKNLTKQFENKTLFTNINLHIKKREVVSIIGNNGCGKSTLLKMIIGDEPCTVGSITLGSNVEIGYLDQEQTKFNYKNTLIEEIHSQFVDMTQSQIRGALASFGFYEDDVLKTLDKLSGGERVRLKLCILFIQRPNFLILDEPTNHLDLPTKEIIENIISSYDGTVLIVSHDRYFINNISDRILSFEDNNLINYIGNYDYYLQKRTNNDVPKNDVKTISASSNDWNTQKKHLSDIRKMQNRIKKIQDDITTISLTIDDANNQMNDEKISSNFEKLAKLTSIIENGEEKMLELINEEEILLQELKNIDKINS